MKVRWGIVSTGKICNDFVNAINSYVAKFKEIQPNLMDLEIVGVAARDKKTAEGFAKTHKIRMVFDSYYEMACNEEIDVVYIGALNPMHYELTKLYLEKEKHVLCEKPLCMNKEQVQNLITLAKEKKRFLMEGVWSRCSPAYKQLKQEIEGGKIGEVMFLEANLGIYSESDRILKKEYGGSAVLDVGVYVLQLSQFIFEQAPIKVTAVGSLNEYGVDTAESIILEYEGGKRAVLNTHTRLKLCNAATVYGTKGHIQEPFHFPTRMIIEASGEKNILEYVLHTSELPYNFENSAGLVYEFLEVSECLKQGLFESTKMTHQESLLLANLEKSIRKQLGVQFECDDEPCNVI